MVPAKEVRHDFAVTFADLSEMGGGCLSPTGLKLSVNERYCGGKCLKRQPDPPLD